MSKYIYDNDTLLKYPLTKTEKMVLGRNHKHENNSPFTTYTVFKQQGEELILSEYGFDKITEFQAPYFSITGSTWYDGREGSGGCIHDTLLEVHPAYSQLVPWHLVNCFGVPMHYLANADYWMQLHLGISRWSGTEGYTKRPPIEILKDHIHYNQELDGEEFQKHVESFDTASFRVWLESRMSRLRKEMQETMLRWGIDLSGVVLKYQQKQSHRIQKLYRFSLTPDVRKERLLNRCKIEFIDHNMDKAGGIFVTHDIDSSLTNQMPFNITEESLQKSFRKLHRQWIDAYEKQYNVTITLKKQRKKDQYEYTVSGTITGFGNPQDGESYVIISMSESILEYTCETVRNTVDNLSIDWCCG